MAKMAAPGPTLQLMTLLMAAAMMMMISPAFAFGAYRYGGGSNYNCAKHLLTDFQFGAAFKPELQALLNGALPQKKECASFALFLGSQLEQWSASSLSQWSARDEAYRRHQASNVLLIAHFRATRGELTSSSDDGRLVMKNGGNGGGLSAEHLQLIESLLKSPLFKEELFMPHALDGSGFGPLNSCAAKVNRTLLKLQTPFSGPLAAYLDSLTPAKCGAFTTGLQSALAQVTGNFSGTGVDLWSASEAAEPVKLLTLQSLLHLLHICAISVQQLKQGLLLGQMQQLQGQISGIPVPPPPPASIVAASTAADVHFGCDDVFASELLLGEIFSHGGGGGDGNFTGAFAAGRFAAPAGGNSTGTTGDSGSGSAFWSLLFWSSLLLTLLIGLYLGLRFLEVIPGLGAPY